MELLLQKIKLLLPRYTVDLALQRVIKENDWLYNEVIYTSLYNHLMYGVIFLIFTLIFGKLSYNIIKVNNIALLKEQVNKKFYLLFIGYIFIFGLFLVLTIYHFEQAITIYKSPVLYLLNELDGRLK